MTQFGNSGLSYGLSSLVLPPADVLAGASLSDPSLAGAGLTGTSATTADTGLFGWSTASDAATTADAGAASGDGLTLSIPADFSLAAGDSASLVPGQLADPGSADGDSVAVFAYHPRYGGYSDSRSGYAGLSPSIGATTITGACTISGSGTVSGSGADTITSSGITALPYNPNLPLGVFGSSDPRTLVADTTQTPYNGIAYVSGTFANGTSFSATAFYIDSTHLVTAGHVAFDLSEGGGFVTSLTVTDGRNGSTSAAATETVTQVAVDPTWYASRSSNENFDLAVLTVSNPNSYAPSTFSLSAATTSTLVGETVSTTGYAGEKGSGTLQGTYQYTTTGTIDEVSNNELYSTHLAITAGDSGSPVYTTTSTGALSAVGIAAWGSTSTDGYTRLTAADVAEIQAYVAASNAGTLSVGASATAVTGGMIVDNVTGATSSSYGWGFGGVGGYRRYG